MENITKPIERENLLTISKESEVHLRETSNWAMFFSILGFIFVGIMIIGSLFFSMVFSFINTPGVPGYTGIVIAVVYFIMGIVYLFPILYLYRFSNMVKTAIIKKNQEQLDMGLKNLKSHYKFIGILTIIIFAIYILIAVGMLFTGAVNNFWV